MRKLAVATLALASVLAANAAKAQLACSTSAQATLLAEFSDSAAVGSITPRNIRDIICSTLNKTDGGSVLGASLFGATPVVNGVSITPGNLSTSVNFGAIESVTNVTPNPGAGKRLVGQYLYGQSSGDNATNQGLIMQYINIGDYPGVTAFTKGTLYGSTCGMTVTVARNNAPFDDANCYLAGNTGNAIGTAAFAVTASPGVTGPGWDTAFTVEGPANDAYSAYSDFAYGLNFVHGSVISTFTGAAIRIPNNTAMVARNAANNANINLISTSAGNNVTLGNQIVVNPTTGAVSWTGSLGLTGNAAVTTLNNLIPLSFTTPATAASACTTGQTAIDASFIYVCIGTNSWHRLANGAAW